MPSFITESALLALIGGVLGVLAVVPFNGLQTGTSNPVTFSEVVFSLHLSPAVVGAALAIGLAMGLLGGFIPAWHAARQNIVDGLRA